MKDIIYTVVLIGATAGATAYAVDYFEKDSIEEVVERQNEAAEQFAVALDSVTGAYEARAQQVLDQQEIIEELEDENGELAGDLGSAQSEILSLSRTVSRLDERYEGEAQGEAEGEEVRVAVSDTARYDRGSSLAVTGTFLLNTETLLADYQLDITGELRVGTTVSRLPSNELRVDVWSDAPLEFQTIEVTHNLDDPIHDRTRSGFLDGLFDFSYSNLLTALAGLGAGLALGGS